MSYNKRKILLGGAASIENENTNEDSDIDKKEQESVQEPIQVEAKADQIVKAEPITSGITKNIRVDFQFKSKFAKLYRTLFTGVPYPISNEITMFQVFPTNSALNSLGNACDQVIVYGKINAGAIADNNYVEVYGHRDSDNNIVAQKIINKASGTTITPDMVIPVSVIWTITGVVFGLLVILSWFFTHIF